jgi:hypothetical protein
MKMKDLRRLHKKEMTRKELRTFVVETDKNGKDIEEDKIKRVKNLNYVPFKEWLRNRGGELG